MSSPDLEHLEDKVTGFLVDLGLPPEPHAEGLYAFRFGSSVVLVSLFEAAGGVWVRLASTLLEGFRPTLDLVTRVLRLNTEVLLGSFLIFDDDTLTFSVTLAGEGLESSTFERALRYVASVSSEHGEELKALAGGSLVSDLLPE
jgi:hypothetical protein